MWWDHSKKLWPSSHCPSPHSHFTGRAETPKRHIRIQLEKQYHITTPYTESWPDVARPHALREQKKACMEEGATHSPWVREQPETRLLLRPMVPHSAPIWREQGMLGEDSFKGVWAGYDTLAIFLLPSDSKEIYCKSILNIIYLSCDHLFHIISVTKQPPRIFLGTTCPLHHKVRAWL